MDSLTLTQFGRSANPNEPVSPAEATGSRRVVGQITDDAGVRRG
jgi:hypothetical protein